MDLPRASGFFTALRYCFYAITDKFKIPFMCFFTRDCFSIFFYGSKSRVIRIDDNAFCAIFVGTFGDLKPSYFFAFTVF
jgi:hypothetical protein